MLISNAGVLAPNGRIHNLTTADWERSFRVNVLGAVNGITAAVGVMRPQRSGSIVLTASVAGMTAWSHAGPYCATKAGLNAFAESLMLEVRQEDIRVTTVMPGSVQTSFSPGGAAAEHDWKLSPDDVAQVVFDLLGHSPRSLPSRVEIRPSKPH